MPARLWLLSCLLLAACVQAPVLGPQNFAANRAGEAAHSSEVPEELPVCTEAQDFRWNLAQEHTLGVEGYDPSGHVIGGFPARKFGVLANWYPIDGEKQVVCGTLHEFRWFTGLGEESDWNLYILPEGPFAFTFDDARTLANEREIADCLEENDCFEAEVTPPPALYHNRYFQRPEHTPFLHNALAESPLVGGPLCLYGPWVREKSHGNRPEIHPAELLWWRDDHGTHLLTVQDASRRFSSSRHFYHVSALTDTSGWQPWAAAPRQGTFRLPFALDPARTEPLRWEIREQGAHRVTTRHHRPAAQDGPLHTLSFENRSLLVVEERQEDGRVDVGFDEVCRDEPSGEIRGFVALTTLVGEEGNEGFHLLTVAPAEAPAPPLLAAKPVLRLQARRVEATKGAAPTGTVTVGVEWPEGTTEKSRVDVAGIAMLREGEDTLTFLPVKGRADLKAPLFAPSAFAVALTSGDTLWAVLPATGLAVEVEEKKPVFQSFAAPSTAWLELSRVLGVEALPLPETVSLVHFTRRTVQATARYAPVRDGQVMTEEEPPFGEKAMQSTKRTVRIEWLPEETAGVEMRMSRDQWQLRFELTALAQARALAVAADAFGNRDTLVVSLWNVALRADSPAALAEFVMSLAEADPVQFRQDAASTSRMTDLASRRARTLYRLAESATADELVHVDELRHLLTAAHLYRGTL